VEQLISLRLLVEGTLDFPEEEIDFLQQRCRRQLGGPDSGDVDRLLSGARQGSLLRNGLHVVLAGQPNVGKSSLLNRLAGEERAIVTAIPGTTRDALRETIQVQGIPLHIVDTAGLRETEDEIERLGIARSWREIGRADVVLHMLDAREGMTGADRAIVARLPGDVEQIVLLNKSDLAGPGFPAEVLRRTGGALVSAKTGDGMAQLEQELLRVAGWQAGAEDVFWRGSATFRRSRTPGHHLLAGSRPGKAARTVRGGVAAGPGSLGSITGEFTPGRPAGEIFSRFCIGK
jgi:tRNA modification GTPase